MGRQRRLTHCASDGSAQGAALIVTLSVARVADLIAPVRLATIAAGSTAGFKIVGETAGDHAGASVPAAGDVSGDGLDDLLVGASGNDAGGSAAGAAYVLHGGADWLV